MSQITVDSIVNSNGLERFACLAWVNFDGTGTVAIRESGNVSSITDNGTGDYTVNFATAMPDTSYSVVTSGKADSATTNANNRIIGPVVYSLGAVRVISMTATNNKSDGELMNVAVFR